MRGSLSQLLSSRKKRGSRVTMASKTRENSPGDEDAASAVSSASPAPLSSPVVAYHTMISKPVTVLEPEWSSDEEGGTHLVVDCAAVLH